jgi:glycosyltransferase involved in cell wall biosynthesis
MKILFCNYEYPPLGGGGGVVMAALARQLARRHEVTVLTSRAGGLLPDNLEGGVRVVRVPVFFRRELAVANFPSMFAYLPTGLARGLRLGGSGAFDIVNTHFVVPTGPLGHALAKWYRVPNVLSIHGGDLFDPSKRSSPHLHAPLRLAVRSMLRKADAVVGQSRDTVRHVTDLYGVRRDIGLIPLGIERPMSIASASRAAFGVPENAFALVTIGRLVARKATAQLVDAIANSAIPNAHLLIVGDGPDREAIERRASERGVADRVHVLGQTTEEDKYAALACADAFISTSQHEGFGLVFLEAMAFGLPVLCYDRGGQTDFLKSNETGFVVRLNNEAEFVRALRQLHDDREARVRFGKHNLQLVENYFIDSCARKYEQVFEDSIARRAPHSMSSKAFNRQNSRPRAAIVDQPPTANR